MAKSPTIISASTTIKGRIQGAEDVELYGRVEGNVKLDGTLYVDEKARLDADIQATEITVHGIVVGNSIAEVVIKLESTARVIGDLRAPRIIIDDGALVRGVVETSDESTSSSPRGHSTGRAARPPKKSTPKVSEDQLEPDEDDDEPEPPKSARKKKVSVKKRK